MKRVISFKSSLNECIKIYRVHRNGNMGVSKKVYMKEGFLKSLCTWDKSCSYLHKHKLNDLESWLIYFPM